MDVNARELTRVISESSQEDTNSLDPSEITGGFGQYTATLVGIDEDERFILSDTDHGRVMDVGFSDGLVTITADSDLAKLNRWYSVPPHIGSFSNYVALISNITGASITSPVNIPLMIVPGYEGNVWDHFRQLISAYNLELGSDAEVVRRPKHETIEVDTHLTTHGWNINAQESTEWVNVLWRDILKTGNSIEVLAPKEHLSVEAGETLVQEIEIPGSLLSVNQPVCVDYVPANTDYSGSTGVYCVAGNDGKPILASRWKNGGGDLRVELTDDPSIVRVIITGSSAEEYSPYQIAATAGSSSYYNSLHVTGSGMLWREQNFRTHTGAPRSNSEKETETEITNPFVVGYDMAVDVALRAAKTNSGGLKNVTFDIAPTGVVTGQRVEMFDGIHRVTSIANNTNNASVTTEPDTKFEDWNDIHGGETFANFNTKFSGQRFIDFNTRSLQ